jgi:hypothetical protein
MRGVVHVAATAVAALGAGCATSVDVTFDESQDFSQYQTWDWLPRGRQVDALPGEERNLDALTSQLVESELRGRGLVRGNGAPDILIGYQLSVVRRLVVVNETGATDLLASHHASPSYLVQSTRTHVELHDYGYLYVVVTNGRRDRQVWRGGLWAMRWGRFERHLPAVVAELLERFPVGMPRSAVEPLASGASP